MMETDDKQVEITKQDLHKVVPAAPRQELQGPKPVKVSYPALLTRPAGVATSCAKCGSPVHRTPSAVPFKGGPYQGGFLCSECWILDWEDNPDIAADAATRQWLSEEARRIKMRRAGGASTLYQDGVNHVYLTQRGTILIDLARLPFGGPDEYDPERVKTLLKLLTVAADKAPGFGAEQAETPPKPAPPQA